MIASILHSHILCIPQRPILHKYLATPCVREVVEFSDFVKCEEVDHGPENFVFSRSACSCFPLALWEISRASNIETMVKVSLRQPSSTLARRMQWELGHLRFETRHDSPPRPECRDCRVDLLRKQELEVEAKLCT